MDYRRHRIYSENIKDYEPGKNSKYIKIVTRSETVLYRTCLCLGYTSNVLYKKFFGFSSGHKPYYMSDYTVYLDQVAMDKEKKQTMRKAQKNPNFLKQNINKCEQEAKKIIRLSDAVRDSNVSSLSNSDLKKAASKLIDSMISMSAFIMMPLSLQSFLEGEIRSFLTKRIHDLNKREKYFGILTTPKKHNTGFYEQVSILKLASRYSPAGLRRKKYIEAIHRHVKQFSWLGVKYGVGRPWTIEQITDRIIFLSKSDPKKRLRIIAKNMINNENSIKKALDECRADKNIRSLVATARAYVYLRTLRSDALCYAGGTAYCLFEEIGKRNNLTALDVLSCMPDEIVSFNFPRKSKIRSRGKTILMLGINGKIKYCYGKKAIKIQKIIKNNLDKEGKCLSYQKKIIKANGTIAYKGLVRGKARIVHDNTELYKVKVGDILIAQMTTPDFVPAMEKAAAFVTDEGGILCHAAVVSREMEKPCLIATKIATMVFKDNERVEVDAIHGWIKKIN